MSEMTKQFDAANGNDFVIHEGRLFFITGATRENHPIACRLLPPPTEPHENARARRNYWTIKLNRAKHEFETMKHNLLMASQRAASGQNNATPPTADQLARLVELQNIAIELRKQYDLLTAEVEQTDPQREIRIRAAQMDRQLQLQAGATAQQLRNINI